MDKKLEQIKASLDDIDLNKKSSADTLLEASAMLINLSNEIRRQSHR